MEVLRAKFSSLTNEDISNAVDNLIQPDKNLNDAAKVRSEIDLRIGASFTRFQSLSFGAIVDPLSKIVLSYGGCQFPTLGFLVER